MKNNPSFDQIKYQNAYNKENYDRVFISLPKGMKSRIKKVASTKGKSLNAYIKELIEYDLTGRGDNAEN